MRKKQFVPFFLKLLLLLLEFDLVYLPFFLKLRPSCLESEGSLVVGPLDAGSCQMK